jgi:hypothetical protein
MVLRLENGRQSTTSRKDGRIVTVLPDEFRDGKQNPGAAARYDHREASEHDQPGYRWIIMGDVEVTAQGSAQASAAWLLN